MSDTTIPEAQLAATPAAPAADALVGDRVERALDQADHLLEKAQQADTCCALSVILPVYNECDTIEQVVQRVAGLPLNKEILVIDDGSTDGTAEVVQRLGENAEVIALKHERNRGKGAAVRTGLSRARGEIVVVQDADLEYEPMDILMLIRPILARCCDVVYGSRYLAPVQQDPSWVHRAGNRMLTQMSNLFTGQRLTDMETCYKVFRRSVMKDVTLRQDRFGIEPELTAKLARRGHRIYEMPISYNKRGYDEGKKIGFRDGISALWCIVRYGIAD